MINLYSINACTNALRLLQQGGLRLSPDDGSPIALLNKATNTQSVYDSSITNEQFYQELPNITALKQAAKGSDESSVVIDGAVGASVLSVEDHEPTLFELKRMTTQRCAGMLDFSRNVIQPFVQLVIQNNHAEPPAEVKEDWALVPVDVDPAINHPIVQALISRLEVPTGAGFSHDRVPVSVPDVVELPETGKNTYDQLVANLLTELGWTMSQALRAMIEPTACVPNSDQAPNYVKQNVLFLLLSAYYLENPWTGSGLDSVKWRGQFEKMHYTLVGWLYLYAETIVTRVKLGNLIFSYDGDNKRIFICQEAFDGYVKAGGCVEALLGAVYLLDDGDTNVTTLKQNLLDNQTQYVDSWSRRSSIRRIDADTDWLTSNRESLKLAFGLAIDQLDPDLLGLVGDQKMTAIDAKKAVATTVDHLFNRGTTDIAAFIIRTACLEVFGEGDLCNLMLSIHEGMINGVKPEDTANDWIINYVLDWMLQGVCIES